MLQRDTFWIGALASIVIPFTVGFALWYFNENAVGTSILGMDFGGLRESFIMTMAVCANFFPFFVYMRAHKDNAMRAVGVVTIVLALLLVSKYYMFLWGRGVYFLP